METMIYLMGATGFAMAVFAILIAQANPMMAVVVMAVAVLISAPMIIKEKREQK